MKAGKYYLTFGYVYVHICMYIYYRHMNTHTCIQREKIEMLVREKVYKVPPTSYQYAFLSFGEKICMAWNCSIKAQKYPMVFLRVL